MTVVDVHKDPQTLTMTLDSLPRTHFRLEVEPVDAAKTRLRIVSTFASAEDMEKLIAMGMDEGIAEAVGQVDALLASDTSGFETLHTSGAVLAYDVHPGGGADAPTLLIVGCPMGADGFATLAGHFVDRTVVTYDPRGAERSRVADGSFTSTPAEHAEDLHRLAQRVSPGRPVDVFASSGGAVNALAWAERHPEDIRRLWRTSRRWLRRSPIVHGRSPRSRTSRRPTSEPAWASAWRSSSRWSATRASSRRASGPAPIPTRHCSACRPKTTDAATTPCSGAT